MPTIEIDPEMLMQARVLMTATASFLKARGPKGFPCASLVTLMELTHDPILIVPVLQTLVDAGLIRHDDSVEPCVMIFIPHEDTEPGEIEVKGPKEVQ